MERLDGLLGVTPIAIGDLILVRVQSFWQEKNLASARQLFRSLAPLSRLGARKGRKVAEDSRELRRRGIPVRKMNNGISATACDRCAAA